MSRVSFQAYEVMWIKIEGKIRPEAATSRLPMTRDDGNLISEMRDFMGKQEIFPLSIMLIGGGCFQGLFTVPDGEKMVKWLNEHGGYDVSSYEEG